MRRDPPDGSIADVFVREKPDEEDEGRQVLADTRSIFKRCLYPSIVADAIACD